MGYCCLYFMLKDNMPVSSRKLEKLWGISYGHICRLKKQVNMSELRCTNATRCIRQ